MDNLGEIIDVNVSFGFWPFQPSLAWPLERLEAVREAEGIGEAWVSAVESILSPDPDIHDGHLQEQLRAYPQFRFVKTVNPMLGNCRESLRRGVELWGACAVKLLPSYHRYGSREYRLHELMEAFVEYDVPLLVQMRVEDERAQSPLLHVPAVPAAEVARLAAYFPEARIVALGASVPDAAALSGCANVYVDIAFIERVQSALQTMPAERVVFGSHAPFFYPRGALMKLQHGYCSDAERRAIAGGNVRRLVSEMDGATVSA